MAEKYEVTATKKGRYDISRIDDNERAAHY